MDHTITRLVRLGAQASGLKHERIIGSGAHRKVARVRFAIMLVATELGYSVGNIASRLGDRHHTTVLSGRKMAKKLLDEGDAAFAALVQTLREGVKNGVQR